MLAGMAIFSEDTSGRFAFTPLGETLRADVRGSVKDRALLRQPRNVERLGQFIA
jgi:hypothetical protein